MRLIATLAICTSLEACAKPRPTVVSQSSMNGSMLDRISAEGAEKCAHEGGLKGVEWPYSNIPGGGRIGVHTGRVPYSDLPEKYVAEADRQKYQTAVAFMKLADAAPRSASDTADASGLDTSSDPQAAKYVCLDGAEEPSNLFQFVP